jgi:CRISPR/Cas system CSM-associated protein Csm3 (group 7 of RAMP superfamily)
MSEVTIRLEYSLHLLGPSHVGSGYGRGLIDRVVVRNASGSIYIPGSSIKGRVRATTESLAKGLGYRCCSPPRPEEMCREKFCISCNLFGSPRCGERLFFSDAHLSEESMKAFDVQKAHRIPGQTQARTQVLLSRYRSVAQDGHLFTSEYAVGNLHLIGTVMGRVPNENKEIPLFLAGLLAVNFLGGSNSRGMGNCRFEIERLSLDDVAVDYQEVLNQLLKCNESEKGA